MCAASSVSTALPAESFVNIERVDPSGQPARGVPAVLAVLGCGVGLRHHPQRDDHRLERGRGMVRAPAAPLPMLAVVVIGGCHRPCMRALVCPPDLPVQASVGWQLVSGRLHCVSLLLCEGMTEHVSISVALGPLSAFDEGHHLCVMYGRLPFAMVPLPISLLPKLSLKLSSILLLWAVRSSSPRLPHRGCCCMSGCCHHALSRPALGRPSRSAHCRMCGRALSMMAASATRRHHRGMTSLRAQASHCHARFLVTSC